MIQKIRNNINRFFGWLYGIPKADVEAYIKRSKENMKRKVHPRLEMRFNPLAMDENVSGPWDYDPDWFKKHPDFKIEGPNYKGP